MGNAAARGARAIERADQTKEAADLRCKGWSLAAIGEHQGVSNTTVMRRLDAYCEKHPMENVERLRSLSLHRLDRAVLVVMEQLDSPKLAVRLEAAKALARIERTRADIAGIVKAAPPIAVSVAVTTSDMDISKLTPDELVQFHTLRAKISVTAP